MGAIHDKYNLRSVVIVFATLFVLGGCESQQTQSQSQSQSQSSSSSAGTSSSSGTSFPSSSSSFPSGSQSTGGRSGDSASQSSSTGQEQGGSQSSDSSDGQQNGQGESGYVVNGEVLTEDEYVRVLEGEMDASVAVFDGMILDERETVQGIEDANPDQGFPDGSGDEPLFEEGDLAGDGEGGVPIPDMPSGSAEGEPGQSGDASNGDPTQTARSDGGVPSDIDDGSDDDIVARQIREAAMKEQDPVLREKLWDEYRKYKNQ